jgi:hypothetical protein
MTIRYQACSARSLIRAGATDVFRSRRSTFEPHLDRLDAYWASGMP